MNKIEIKTFMLQKDGAPSSCKDALDINADLSRFAIADGVSRSYYPDITAAELCRIFVNEQYDFSDWEVLLKDKFLFDLTAYWMQRVQLLENELDECDLYDTQLQREMLPAGSSTLAGIEINRVQQKVFYNILGDSTVFQIRNDMPLISLCSSPTERRDGYDYILYNNYPDCITSVRRSCKDDIQLRVAGCWASGALQMDEGYIMLMTDGIAQWFQDEYIANGRPVADFLWNIPDQTDFEKFVESCRRRNRIDDDVAVIMLKITDNQEEGCKVLYRGDLEFKGIPQTADLVAEPFIPKTCPQSFFAKFINSSWL